MTTPTPAGPANRLANFFRPRKQAVASENKHRLDATVTKTTEESSQKSQKSIQVLCAENEALKNDNDALKKQCGDLQDRLQRVEQRLGIVGKDGDSDDDEQEVEEVDAQPEDGVDKRCTASKEATQSKSEKESSPFSFHRQAGMSRYDHRLLPPELWLSIIRWATHSQSVFDLPTFEPFHASFERQNKGEAGALAVRHAVVQVCKLWRDFGLSSLYEDVMVRHGAPALAEELGKTYGGEQLGTHVRRLELPYPYTGTATNTSSDLALQILQSCPGLETLVRPFMPGPPDAVRYEFPTRSHPFPNLKRLEWWHYNDAARSGGINSLIDVLCYSPNLQYLVVGGEMWSSAPSTSDALVLPALTTLRVRRINVIFVQEICRWQLPSLVHVVAEFPLEQDGLEDIWRMFGARLCTVEFGRHVGFLLSDQITPFLAGCPQVQKFNYFLNFTYPPPIFNQPCALQSISLHAHPCFMVTDMIPNSQERLERHLAFLSRSSFPALRRIILYGDWGDIIPDPLFTDFTQSMNSRGCLIEYATGDMHSCTPSPSA
ncbi:uncharacterized protein EDB91DRAFT_1109491 [Suillus paluster]|uniref:uncharacterized protein n=1 Tax=Suillus paluster TaxID=48578 RepID=UPI001B87B66F|nr:uncharacterized protein EDB91DRAFT_1109491 [Suillus paluster]KAG1749755.1 hypothetical protein EDB91DRAFT_1109491 [Suillus paluster]